jgi:hypothetical protein
MPDHIAVFGRLAAAIALAAAVLLCVALLSGGPVAGP